MRSFSQKLNFLTVYILEAHAEDTWPLGLSPAYCQTYNVNDRSKVAKDFIRDNGYDVPLKIDDPNGNPFNTVFAAWPLRFYVIGPDGTMIYIHEPEGDKVLATTFKKWLEEHYGK